MQPKEQTKEVTTKKWDNLSAVAKNPELAELYRKNASVGAENLGGELPLLKVHSTGRSTKNYLADGSEPLDGWFFYKPEKVDFEEVECHILTVSKGYKAEGYQSTKEKFNQIVAGTIVERDEDKKVTGIKPFIMYFNGLKLKNLWAFGKEASRFTKSKDLPIPLFALTVKLTTSRIKNSFEGMSWVVNFEILKNPDDSPWVVTDLEMFKKLKQEVEIAEGIIENLIEEKKSEDETDKEEVLVKPVQEARGTENIEPSDIPF